MCEINPKFKAFFRLEAFASPADTDLTAEQFQLLVLDRLLAAEQQLNADGRFRFHIHGEEQSNG